MDWKTEVANLITSSHVNCISHTLYYDEVIDKGIKTGVMTRNAADVFEALQLAFRDAPHHVGDDLVLFRGTSGVFDVGQSICYVSPSSFTATKRVAAGFAKRIKNRDHPVLLRLVVDRPVSLLYFSTTMGTSCTDFDEDEYLFNCGASFVVTSIDECEDIPIVNIRLADDFGTIPIPTYTVDESADEKFTAMLELRRAPNSILKYHDRCNDRVYIWSQLFRHIDETDDADYFRLGCEMYLEDKYEQMYRDWIIGNPTIVSYQLVEGTLERPMVDHYDELFDVFCGEDYEMSITNGTTRTVHIWTLQ